VVWEQTPVRLELRRGGGPDREGISGGAWESARDGWGMGGKRIEVGEMSEGRQGKVGEVRECEGIGKGKG